MANIKQSVTHDGMNITVKLSEEESFEYFIGRDVGISNSRFTVSLKPDTTLDNNDSQALFNYLENIPCVDFQEKLNKIEEQFKDYNSMERIIVDIRNAEIIKFQLR